MHANQIKKLERLEAAWTVAKSHETSHPKEYQKAKRELTAYRRDLRIKARSISDNGDGDATAITQTLKAQAKPRQE